MVLRWSKMILEFVRYEWEWWSLIFLIKKYMNLKQIYWTKFLNCCKWKNRLYGKNECKDNLMNWKWIILLKWEIKWENKMDAWWDNVHRSCMRLLMGWIISFYKDNENCWGVLFFYFFLWVFGIWKIYNNKKRHIKICLRDHILNTLNRKVNWIVHYIILLFLL